MYTLIYMYMYILFVYTWIHICREDYLMNTIYIYIYMYLYNIYIIYALHR